MSRHFTRASSERIAYSLGAMTAFPFGTAACVIKVGINFTGGSFSSIFSTDAASDDALAFFIDGDNSARMSTYNGTGGAVNGAAGQGIAVADGWVLCAWTKATGTVTPRFHRIRYSANDSSHAAAGATSPDPALTLTGIKVGANHTNADAFDGDMAALMLLPKIVMSDSEIDRLAGGRWDQYVDGGVGWMMEFHPKDAPVAGASRDGGRAGSRETAIVGTSRGTTDPPGFRWSRFRTRK